MKKRILNLILPMAAIMFAVAGAFASHTSSKGILAPQTGYIDSLSPCSVAVSSNNSFGPICTALVNGVQRQAYGKINPQDATCAKVLYRD